MLPRLAPGDPAVTMAGPDATIEQIEAVRDQLGMSGPLVAQYTDWVGGLLTGDMGTSAVSGRPVSELISSRVATTVELAVAAVFLMIVIGTTVGTMAGTSRRPRVGLGIDWVNSILLATPPFLTGLLLILLFGVTLDWLPYSGSVPFTEDPIASVKALVLPAFALALPPAAAIARLIQAEMRRVRQEQFVELATAKGVPARRITLHHVLRNSYGSAIVQIGISAGTLLAGAVIIEAIFARNGLGQLAVQGVTNRDYQVVQVVIVGAVVIAVAMQLSTELLLASLDPRVRLS
jgi:peptide/nickel transport system permease protein